MNLDILIGKNLRRLRKLAGISQERLAKLVGTTSTRLSAYENGRDGMGKDIMSRICKALNVEYYEFYLTDNTPILKDNKEKYLIHIYRKIQKIDKKIADELIRYGEWKIERAEKNKKVD
jgi:transcriptional regulator with XRE-family HTH domain